MRNFRIIGICILITILPLFPGAHPSWGIEVGTNGTIYVADVLHGGLGVIWKVDSDGSGSFLKETYHCHALAKDDQGRIWAAGSLSEDPGLHSLIHWDAEEVVKEAFRTPDDDVFFPGPLGVDGAGNCYFAVQKKLVRRTTSGTFEPYSAHEFKWVNSLTTSTDGTTYVVDKGIGSGTLYCVDPDGKTTWMIDSLFARPATVDFCTTNHDKRILGMATDPTGNVYLAANCEGAILKVAPDGTLSTFYQSKDQWYPTGLTFSDKDTYVLEVSQKIGFDGPRVIRLDANGKEEIIVNLHKAKPTQD